VAGRRRSISSHRSHFAGYDALRVGRDARVM
jgi:hypothetical protein